MELTLTQYTIGRAGPISAQDKCEGDGATPLGNYALREVWFRPDRVQRLATALPAHHITPQDCWCDDAAHALYNQHFTLGDHPPASFEHLWREDGAYDVIVVLGYNDAPPIAGKGSAIFIHCMHDDGRPTAGCVALEKPELLDILSQCGAGAKIQIGIDSIAITSLPCS